MRSLCWLWTPLLIAAAATPSFGDSEKREWKDDRPKEPTVQRISLADWLELEGPGFRIYSSSGQREIVRRGKYLLSFRELVREVTGIDSFAPRSDIRIIVLPGRDYPRFGPPRTAGFMLPGAARWQLVVNRNEPARQETLLHEYTHFLIWNQGLGYPRWYDEGFAELIATARFRDDIVMVGAPPADRMATLRIPEPTPLSLREVLGARSYPGPAEVPWFYAQAWLLTHYLHTAHGFGEPRMIESMRRYLALLHANTPWAIAFGRAFEPSVEELEQRLVLHRARLLSADATYPMLRVRVALPDTGELRLRTVSTARIAELLGDLQLDTRGATRLAEALYRESLERDPGRASAEAGLATVLARQGRVVPARELVDAAVATEPDSLPIRLALGEVQALAARASDPPDPVRMEEARATLRALVQRYPDQIAPSVALGISFIDVEGDPSEGIAALERVGAEAPALVPGLPLAKLYLAAGRHADARTQLRTVVRWSAGEPAEEARKLLEELERRDPGPDG